MRIWRRQGDFCVYRCYHSFSFTSVLSLHKLQDPQCNETKSFSPFNTSTLTIAYRGLVERVLTNGITVQFDNTTHAERNELQRLIKTAGQTIGSNLPSKGSIYTQRCKKRAEHPQRPTPACSLFLNGTTPDTM